MNRHLASTSLTLALGWVAFVATTSFAVEASKPGRPNIVIFLVDDMGVMDTSVPFLTDASGKPQIHPLNQWYRTPAMERLASQGIRFNTFYAMSVCSPTRVAIMTGENSARHHVTNWINAINNNCGRYGPSDWRWDGIGTGDTTLPAVLAQAGYRTIHVGKAHFGCLGSFGANPLNLGFHVNIAGSAIGFPASYYGLDGFGNTPRQPQGRNSVYAVPDLKKYHGQDIYLTEALTREANAEITRAVESRQPFFLYLAHYAVHYPFQPDPRFSANYENSEKIEPAKAFATMIEGVDKSLGDVLDHLDRLGIAEDTLVFFLGDNGTDAPIGGEAFAAAANDVLCSAPLCGRKGTRWEGGMRVPFIASWAKTNLANAHQRMLPIRGGTIYDGLSVVYDLYPTILSIAGIECDGQATIDGIDISSCLVTKPRTPRKRTFLMHFPHEQKNCYFTVLRDGAWKVIYNYYPDHGQSRYELFNLATDPSESQNVADSKRDKLREMMRELTVALEQAGAQYPVDDKKTPLKPEIP